MYAYHWDGLLVSFGIAMAVSAVPTLAIAYLARRLGRWGELLPAAIGPTIWGWILSANVLLAYWPYSAEGALFARAVGSGTFDIASQLDKLSEYAWTLLPILVLALVPWAAWHAWRRRAIDDPGWVFVLVGFTMIASTALGGLRTFADQPSLAEAPGTFGLPMRVFLGWIAAVSIGYLWVRLTLRYSALATARVIVLAVLATSLWHYYNLMGPAVADVRAFAAHADTLAERNIVEHDGQVLCARARIPKDCALAYAFNHSRYPGSVAVLPPPPVRDDAVCYIKIRSTISDCLQAERAWARSGCARRQGRLLVAQEVSPETQFGPDVPVETGPFYNQRMALMSCPAPSGAQYPP